MVPDSLVQLTTRWVAAGRPPQTSIPWNPDSWKAWLPEFSTLIDSLPMPISRKDVEKWTRQANAGEHDAVQAFVVSMVWGYGTTGYGPWRTQRVLTKNPEVFPRLVRAADIERRSGDLAAYSYMALEGRLKFLGPAFGTKFLHFVSERAPSKQPLILDAVVSRALMELAGLSVASTAWSDQTYLSYLKVVRAWSDDLKVDPPDLERILFASQQPAERAEPWVYKGVPLKTSPETRGPTENNGEQ